MNVLLAPILFVMPELDAFYTFSHLLRNVCPLYVQGNFDGVHYGLDVRGPAWRSRSVRAAATNAHDGDACPEWSFAPAVQLLDECLRFVDPVLFQHLASKHLTAKVYAFPCTPLPWPGRRSALPGLAANLFARTHAGESMVCGAAVLTLCACTPPLEEVLKLWDFFFAFGVHLAVLCFIGQCLMIRDDLLRSPQYARRSAAASARGPVGSQGWRGRASVRAGPAPGPCDCCRSCRRCRRT